jgi:hypothetical protein
MVCKGNEKSMTQLYGSWEESFGLLFNWKAEVVMRIMSNSVVEIDIELKDDMPYFRRFFCALGSCIDGFYGCRPYFSIICKLSVLFCHIEMLNCLTNALQEKETKE